MTSLTERFFESLGRLPLPLQRMLRALTGPRSPIFKAYLLASGVRPSPVPPATELPAQTRRVFIAPVNSAEQAMLWASAIQENLPDLGARNLVAPIVGGSIFETTEPVPLGAFHLSRKWQRAEFERISEFTHVLVESQRPMFGGLFGYKSVREITELRARGVSVAAMSHGSDTRDLRAHAQRTPWSPFAQPHPGTAILQDIAERTRAEMRDLRLPIFVSTPDLLDDLPEAHWCPLIVDPIFLKADPPVILRDTVPVVTHIPSNGWMKGTELVTPVAEHLNDLGRIDYRPMENIPRAEMPAAIAASDILLEQFRIGSYGATAVEAMASGRVVIGHVMPSVRERVLSTTGLELPIVEAVGDTLEQVLNALVSDPTRMHEIAELGKEYVKAVHNGELSAAVLSEHWIDSR